ncbi:MAG: mercury methylation corrinoid protein HgcA [Thermodesulfovibrionales bacterium]
MAELKIIQPAVREAGPTCCGISSGTSRPAWVTGALTTDAGETPVISTDLSRSELWEHVRCRVSAFRDRYSVEPGLYAVGTPGRDSDVFASASYKLSFDVLRKALRGLNAWVLVLDTRGINVWCAAGKGTFGTEELVRRISAARLGRVVDHRRIIVPQLGGPGISAHLVKKATGFSVSYGPVRAEDISGYIGAGYTATKEMRTVRFPLVDRLVLTPMEINPAMKKYFPWYALAMLAVFGLQPEGILFRNAVSGALPFLLLGLVSVLAGAFVTPLLLPLVPFRSFAVKGWIMGMASTFCFVRLTGLPSQSDALLHAFTYLFFPLASSYIALQFTGSTTFTGMSGVKKELKVSIPLYLAGTAGSLVLLALYKLGEWRII